jgi:hypothetical protein
MSNFMDAFFQEKNPSRFHTERGTLAFSRRWNLYTQTERTTKYRLSIWTSPDTYPRTEITGNFWV